MTDIFNTVVYMSSIASIVALTIMIVRVMLKRICPTIFSYLLWGVLLVRLITPVSFSSMLSFFNWYAIPKQLEVGNSGITQIQQSIEGLNTPIIYGVFEPKIIIPSEMLELQDQSILKNVISHEIVHLGRKDHIIKLITLLVACVHWFNPLVWISLHLAHKDMEKSCDEKVVKYASKDIRKEYAEALLSFNLPKNQLSRTIGVAFGESDMKSRIKGILKYKKPSF